ncbi:MAG: hypothetical protein GY816_03125 [Cytophagales bacterium]|nr:hypothetical protein [Cytophagales bacterium]
MKKDEMRKTVIINSGMKCYFHEFGTTYYEGNNGVEFGVTGAIVEEIDTGLVYIVKPDGLKFID